MIRKNALITVQEISDNFKSWSERPYIGRALKESILQSNVLIVPGESYADKSEVFFPQQTEEFIRFLKDNKPPEIQLEVCVEDSDYKELSRYADFFFLPTMFATSIVAPLIVKLVWHFLSQRLARRKETTAEVKWSLAIEDKNTGHSFSITYEGPAVDLENRMQKAIQVGSESIAKPLPTVSEPTKTLSGKKKKRK